MSAEVPHGATPGGCVEMDMYYIAKYDPPRRAIEFGVVGFIGRRGPRIRRSFAQCAVKSGNSACAPTHPPPHPR